MTDLTQRIPTSIKGTKETYPFKLRRRTPGYTIALEPHVTRALETYSSAIRSLVERIDAAQQPFGLRVHTTSYETELETWVLPAAKPSFTDDEEKEMEIQLLGKTLIDVFRDIRGDAESIAKIIDKAMREIGGNRHGSR